MTKLITKRQNLSVLTTIMLFLVIILTIAPIVASAATITVGSSGADYTTIQAAINASSASDTIYVYNGSYTENVNVNKQVTLRGEGADVVNVSAASEDDHVFDVTVNYVNISGFNVTRATGSGGFW